MFLFTYSLDKKLLDKVVEYETKLAAYTNPSFAIVHSEYLVNLESGEIRVVESALRGGGVYISSDLIPMCTGIDINEVLLNKALGKNIDVDTVFAQRQDKASAYICFYLPDGVVESISGAEEIKALPFVRRAYIDDIKIGQKTEKMTYKGARKGPILVQGENRKDLERNIMTVQNLLDIKVRKTDGQIAGIVWG